MITHRIATAFRRQEWATILIEFVLVIAGVLIALQLDQWKDALAEREQEETLLLTVLDNVKQDVVDLENMDLSLKSISEFGATAIASLAEDDCGEKCWVELVAFFHASQWIDVELNRETYDEMKRAGLLRDSSLKDELSRYYAMNGQSTRIFSDFPRYRELVRSIIPAATQEYLWTACFRVEGRHQYLIADCPAPENGSDAREIIGELRANAEIRTSLNFWLSTVAVVKGTLQDQISRAKSIIASFSSYMDER